MDDIDLIREYAFRNSEEAFATLVSRHINLVYSAALRQSANHHQAQEITQAVFVILARKARSLGPGTILPGWLFRTARLTAANYLRAETRRARREQEAFMHSNPSDNPDEIWHELAPALDQAIFSLGARDRDAIVLRFLKDKDYKEVAAALGGTEEAAQMRVSRALEKLRKQFAKRGVVLSAAVLGGALATHGTQAAPVAFAASVATNVIQGTALTASTLTVAEGTIKLMAWTKLKIAIGVSLAALLVYQYHENSVQAKQLASARSYLSAQVEALAGQESRIAELERQNAAIGEIRRVQEVEIDRLRSRRRASSPASPAASAGAPTTLLSATLQDPEARQILRTRMVNNYRSRYGPLAAKLNIDPQTGEELVEMAGDGSIRILEAVAAFTDGKITADAALNAEAEAIQNATNQIRLKLGEEGLAKFEEYNRSYPAQELVAQFNKLLGPFPISASQREALSRIIQEEPVQITTQLAGEIPVQLVVHPEDLPQRLEQQAEINQRIRQNAAAFLAPDQVETLELMQANNLSAQKQNILRMLRKL